MEKYNSYKESGVQWLGQVPSHWEMKRFRYLLTENAKQNTDLKERTQLQFRYGDIVQKANQSEDSDVLKTIQKYTVVQPGDIMINGLNLNYDFISQRVAQVQEPGVITSAYISLRPAEGVNSKFYTYFMKAMDAQKLFHGMGSGVRLTLAYANLKNLFFPYPSPAEQAAIVAYLDAATAKIDEAIAQQQHLVELLNERKQIITNRIITKGLKQVPMKESGLPFIGTIPAHWEIRRLKTIVSKVGSGVTPRGGGDVYVDEGVLFIRSQNVYFEGFKLDDVVYIPEEIDQAMSNSRVQEGDVLFNITGGSIGRCHYVPKGFPRANVNQHVSIIRPIDFSSEYLYYLLRSKCCQTQVDLLQTGGNREGLNAAALKNFYLPIPPKEEMESIMAFLESKDKSINQAIADCNQMIVLLQERKQIIIDEVVTGKIKV